MRDLCEQGSRGQGEVRAVAAESGAGRLPNGAHALAGSPGRARRAFRTMAI